MIRDCYRCPAHSWLKEAKCRLGYEVKGYLRPDNCPKKPKSDREMFILLRDSVPAKVAGQEYPSE